MTTKNTAKFGGGDYLDMSLHDRLHPHVETKDVKDIVADVVERAGITIV